MISQEQKAEISVLRNTNQLTLRPTCRGIEDLMYTPHQVLDHGFVRVIDYMGNDAAITQAARVSYGTGTKSVSNDEGLIRYLMRHWHSTPFEMCELKLHVKLPVFVARQWIRHRTANVNEYSARYSILDREFYIPQPEHLAAQSKTNNQGRGEVLQGEEAQRVQKVLFDDAMRCYDNYEAMASDEGQQGLARELARMNLPTSIYTQWYWKVNLHNLMHFLRLRADPHAQYEIRVYADEILKIMEAWVPLSTKAFLDYRLNAKSFSSAEVDALKTLLAGREQEVEAILATLPQLSEREKSEFLKKLL